MCSANGLTYGGEIIDGYRLSDAEAAALRVPMISYADGRVPVEVVAACVGDKLDLKIVNVEDGTVDLSEVLAYLKTAGQSGKVADAGISQGPRLLSLVK